MNTGIAMAALSFATAVGNIAAYYPKMMRNRATLRPRREQALMVLALALAAFFARYGRRRASRWSSIRTRSSSRSYRAPFRAREARLPTLIWPRQIPIDGEPADVVAIVEAYGRWLAGSRLPKLFVAGDPGAIISANGPSRARCRTWPNQREITVPGRHFLQEDSPTQIGTALRDFIQAVRTA